MPRREEALQQAVGRTHFLCAQYINRLHGRSGHIWEGRFFSCALDDAHALEALRYVERNPVRAKMTRAPWMYPWSSAAAHTGRGDSAALLDIETWRELAGDLNWSEWLTERDDASALASVRLSTHTGRPLATDSFLAKPEVTLGRRLRPLPVGRPAKKEN